MKTCPKIWNDPMMCVTKTKSSTGRRRGSVIAQKLRHPVAPSMAAASYSSRGMSCSPAR